MSRALLRDKEKPLQFEAITPEEVRKRARASQSSGLTSSLLSRSLDVKPSLPVRQANAALSPFQKKSSQQDLRQHGSTQAALNELTDTVEANTVEESGEDDISPGSRPIQRKMRVQKRVEEPQSHLSKSVNDDDFVPPHILSFPAQSYHGADLCSHPGSLYEGAGRKLRGMDAVRFRRNVMRQTGFLESSAENTVR